MTTTVRSDSSTPRLMVPTTISFAGRGLGGVLLVAFQVLVARRVGVEGLGSLSIALALASIAAVLGRFGSDLMVMRDVASADDAGAAAIYRQSVSITFRSLLLCAVLLGVAAPIISSQIFGTSAVTGPLIGLALAVPGYGLVALQGEMLKSRHRVAAGTAVQSLIGISVATGLLLVWPDPTATSAAICFAIGATLASLGAHVAWRRTLAVPIPASTDRESAWSFAARSRPFLANSMWSMGLTWAPLLAVGAWATTRDAGDYAAADRVAQILPLLLVAINTAVAPVVAPLWARSEIAEIRRIVARTSRWTTAAAFVICGSLALLAPFILDAFGTGQSGLTALRVLLAGQFVVLAAGPMSVTLAMSGGEVVLHRIGAVTFAAQVALLVALVPRNGATGAAIAAAVSWATSRVVIALVTRRKLLT